MIRDNSKNSLRIANIKVYTPNSLTLMTPTSGNNTNASARILNQKYSSISSPTIANQNSRRPSTQRKIINIDLKQQRNKIQTNRQSSRQSSQTKKIVKMRRKTQSADKLNNKETTKKGPVTTICFSQRRINKTESSTSLNPQLKCFEQVNTSRSGHIQTSSTNNLNGTSSFNKNKSTKETNWDEIVQNKKQQLYSQLYKMDKKILALQRDLDEMPNKRTMIQMIKKKISNITPTNTSDTATNTTNTTANTARTVAKQNCPLFVHAQIQIPNSIQLHKNIYKLAKNKSSCEKLKQHNY